MPADIGAQTITVKFFDPVDSDVANRIALGVRKTGIYSGGYLTKINDTTASLSAFDCEIGDGIYQIRGATAIGVNVTVAPATPYIIIRWTYSASASADYMEILGVASGSVTTNDIIVGVCVFSGSTLSGFDYTLRTNPNVFDLFLKTEPTVAASMYGRVRAGRVSYGTTMYDIIDQLSPLFTAPSAGLTRLDLLQVSALGALAITQGTPVSIPSTPTAPSQNNLVTLAEILLIAGQTTITILDITDTRSYVATNFSVGTGGLVPQGGVIMWSGTVAALSSAPMVGVWQLCDGNNGSPNLTDRFVIHADADSGGTNDVGDIGGASNHGHGAGSYAVNKDAYLGDVEFVFGVGGRLGSSRNNTGDMNSTQVRSNPPVVGTSASGSNRDKYYALAYIMKL